MSVVLGDTLSAFGRQPSGLPAESVVCAGAPEDWGVAVLEVAFLRQSEEQEILRTPEDAEPAHGDVRGTKGSGRRKRLKAHADWVIQPARPPG
jgi:hypothetical protein